MAYGYLRHNGCSLPQLKSKTLVSENCTINLFSKQAKAALNETTVKNLQITSNDEQPEPTVICKTPSLPTGDET